MPPELQRAVHAVVCQTKDRSGWPVRRSLQHLGVSPASYYRWRQEEQRAKRLVAEPARPVQAYEATAEEKCAVRAYALRHPGIRHRELAWRMVDEEVAYLSPSTVYRILKGENLVCPWRRRQKRTREEDEKAQRADEIWASDLMYVEIGGRMYYLLNFLDEYSRLIVHHALVPSMDGMTVSVEAQAAIEQLLREQEIPSGGMPRLRSDNGSCYISREFRGVLDEHGLGHQRIKPHCPEENGIMERSNRTLREALDGEELTDLLQAQDVIARIIAWYNTERLHSALGYLRPIDYYRGDPAAMHDERRRKLAEARHRRREKNLKLRQPTLPLESLESVANHQAQMSHCG